MEPAIAKIIRDMAVHDGTLRTQITPLRGHVGGTFEVAPGSTRQEQVHPVAGSRPQQSLGEHPTVLARRGAPSSTGPTMEEILSLLGPRLSHTGAERGAMLSGPSPMQQVISQMASAIPFRTPRERGYREHPNMPDMGE